MVRWSAAVAGTLTVVGVAFVAGAAVPEKAVKPPEAVKADAAKPPLVVGQKTGYFNMAKVMREYKRAKTSAATLQAHKDRILVNLNGLRAMYEHLQSALKTTPVGPRRDQIETDMRLIARRVEDLDRDTQRLLNERATAFITSLYDELYAVAEGVARENSLSALLAYPDAVTREDRDNPFIKELKLKPPALQPFYVESSVEFSDEIVRRLNEKFDAENP
jgi:Skp family chaperone for outer membrane proteins